MRWLSNPGTTPFIVNPSALKQTKTLKFLNLFTIWFKRMLDFIN